MAYATVDDVKRVAGISESDTDQDSEILAALEAVESWLATKLKATFTAGPTTQIFHTIRSDGLIQLAEPDSAVTAVVDENGYPISFKQVAPDRIRLGGSGWRWPGAYSLTAVYRIPTYFPEVHVTYTSTEGVPPAIREAVAMIAAEYLPRIPNLDTEGNPIAQVRSERIGDYSVTFDNATIVEGIALGLPKARRLLRPWLRRKRVVVV